MLTNVLCRQPPDFAPLVSEPHTSSSAGRPDDEDGGSVGGRAAAAGAVGKRGAATGAPIRLRFRAHHVRRVEYGFPDLHRLPPLSMQKAGLFENAELPKVRTRRKIRIRCPSICFLPLPSGNALKFQMRQMMMYPN